MHPARILAQGRSVGKSQKREVSRVMGKICREWDGKQRLQLDCGELGIGGLAGKSQWSVSKHHYTDVSLSFGCPSKRYSQLSRKY